MFLSPKHRSASHGVTLLELVTVVLVLGILITIMLPVYANVRRRMDKAGCIANLRALHVAADSYIQDHHGWPQVKSDGVEPNELAVHWVNTLRPYGLSEINWVCPTVQRALENPDLTKLDNARIDYAPMAFDTNPQTPFRWSMMPWFAESADAHGNGQLILFADGHVQELGDFKEMLKKKGSSSTGH